MRTDDACTGGSDGVAQSNCTTVHVHLGQVQVQQSTHDKFGNVLSKQHNSTTTINIQC